MINLNKINPSYLYSFGETKDLDLKDKGLCIINGDNQDDIGSHNDVGKTGLMRSVTRLLYDQDRSSATVNSVPNKVLNKGCASCITFDANQISYRVILTRNWRGKSVPFDVENSEIINSGDLYKGSDTYLEILENGIWRDIRESSSSKTKTKIQDILGLTFEQFEASSYMAQNSNFLALSGKPSDKFALVQPFLNFEVWDNFQEKIATLLQDLNLKIQDINNKIQIAEASFNNLEDSESLYKAYEDICKEIFELEKLRDEDHSHLEDELHELKENEREIQESIFQLNHSCFYFSFQNELTAYEAELEDIKNDKNKKEQKAKANKESAKLLASEMKTELAVVDAEIKRLESKIRKTESLGAECQTCGQPIENKELTICNLRADLDRQMAIKYEVNEKLNSFLEGVDKSYQAQLKKIEDSHKEREEFVKSEVLKLKKEKIHEEGEFNNNKLFAKKDLTNLLKEHQSRVEEIQKQLQKKEIIKAQIDLAEQRRRDIVERRMNIAEKIQQYQDQIANLQLELERLMSDKTQYELLDKHLGMKGIRNFETMTILSELSDYASEFLARLSGGMVNISISPYKESKDNSSLFAGVSKITEVVKDSFKEGVPVSLSGGAVYRQMSIAIMFALRAIAQARGLGTNVLFLDEIDRDMSGVNTDRLVSFLSEFKDSCSSIFIISHNERLKNTIHHDNEILITRKNGVSTIT